LKLEAENLACVRGDRRLFKGVGLTLNAGELLHVRGPNGSGKTTLLRMLCGLVRPEDGEIRWNGEPIDGLGEGYLSQITYVGHHNAIKDELTGPENLYFYAQLAGFSATDKQIKAALERLGMNGYEEIPCKVLSQGQRRRTALARLLISDHPVWVMDEPFNALDVGAVATLQDALREHLGGGGMVLLTTHQDVPIDGTVRTLHMGA
jgi:heme exporter protein A